MGLVGFVLRRRQTPTHRWDDEFQDGLLGLMRAAQKFEPARGFRFSTYAMAWIKQGIQRGEGNVNGVSYRYARSHHEEWEEPLSGDAEVPGTDFTFNELLVSPSNVENNAVENVTADDTWQMLHACCKDDFDHALLDSLLDGDSLSDIGRRGPLTAQAVKQRRDRIGSRLRHPTGAASIRKGKRDINDHTPRARALRAS